jgi:NTP pyrophosphatase (non-canonical NTP hydrolase)
MKNQIIEWANERGLVKPENVQAQTIKLMEECGELAGAILKKDTEAIVDAIGDIQVVLIILSEQLVLPYDKCLEIAYEQIKDRKGKMVNGSFVKNGN